MMSVMVVGAGAAFTDQKDIVNTEAVDMCVALNIIGGYPDGSYKPEGNITRAEMCKMICVALNGGKEPATATKSTPSFTDIGNTWAEGYIEYCYAKGVVSGVGGGKFNPSGNVTATQAAKMLLVALGYNADVEKYTGSNWELYVNVQANQDGLYKGLESIDTSAALTRDNAAQMIWNTLQAYVITKDSTIDRTDGSISDTYIQSTYLDLLEKMYDGEIKEGTLTSFDYNSNKAQWTYSIGSVDVVSSTDYTALLGQNVKAVYDNSKPNASTHDAYGIFAVDSQVILTGVVGDLPNLASGDTSFKLDGVTYKLDGTVATTNVYAFTGASNTTAYTAATLNALAGKTTSGTTTTNVTAYDAQNFTAIDKDGNGKIDFFVIAPFQVLKVTYVSSTDFKVTGNSNKIAKEDVNVYDGIAKNDYVIYTAAANTADETDTYVKADLINGKITAVKSGNEAQIDGTWYTFDDSYSNVSTDCKAGTTLSDAVVVNGYIFASTATNAKAISDYVVVVGADTSFGQKQAKLLFSNGEKTVVNLASSSATATIGQMYTYSTNSDGEYILNATLPTTGYDLTGTAASVVKASNSSNKAGYITAATGTKSDGTAVSNISATIADDAVVFIAYDKTTDSSGNTSYSYKVVTGAQMKKMNYTDFQSVTRVLATESSNVYNVDMAYVTIDTSINDADTYYGYVTGVTTVRNSDDTADVKSVTLWTKDGEQTYNTAAATISGDAKIVKGNVIEYKLNSDNELSSVVTGWDVDASAVTAASSSADGFGTIAITSTTPTLQFKAVGSTAVTNQVGGKYLDLNSDTEYLYIENSDIVGSATGTISAADDAASADGKLIANAFVVFNTDGDVLLLVYDIDNDINE
jgi:hypothetical protein